MKFLLIFTICSMVNGNCLDVMSTGKKFDSFRECTIAGYEFIAEQKYATLPEDQKKALVDTFGNEPDKPKRGFFENAARYSGAYWAYKGLTKVAQLTDRAYRTGQIALEETNIPFVISGDKPRGITTASEAWKVAGETGELVFNPSRMEKAKKKYGEDRIAVAIKADSGMPLDEIQATGTPAEQKIAAKNLLSQTC